MTTLIDGVLGVAGVRPTLTHVSWGRFLLCPWHYPFWILGKKSLQRVLEKSVKNRNTQSLTYFKSCPLKFFYKLDFCVFIIECPGDLPTLVGDGYCDDVTNTADCNYDGGDCCLDAIQTNFCFNCICLDPSHGKRT